MPACRGQHPQHRDDPVRQQVVGVLDRAPPEDGRRVQRQPQLPVPAQPPRRLASARALLEQRPRLLVDDELRPELLQRALGERPRLHLDAQRHLPAQVVGRPLPWPPRRRPPRRSAAPAPSPAGSAARSAAPTPRRTAAGTTRRGTARRAAPPASRRRCPAPRSPRTACPPRTAPAAGRACPASPPAPRVDSPAPGHRHPSQGRPLPEAATFRPDF